MSSIFKQARVEFVDGPLENHLAFIGEDIGGAVHAIEIYPTLDKIARYEKVGQGAEQSPDGSERVVYSMRHTQTTAP